MNFVTSDRFLFLLLLLFPFLLFSLLLSCWIIDCFVNVKNFRPYILGIHPDAMARDEVKGQIGKVMIANLDENTISVPPGVAEPPEYEVFLSSSSSNNTLFKI